MNNLAVLAARLRAARQYIGYETAKDFVHDSGFNYSRYVSYEGAKRRPSAEILLKICNELGFNLNWMTTGDGEPFNSKTLKKDVPKDKKKLEEILNFNLNMLDKPSSGEIDKALLTQIMTDITNITSEQCEKCFAIYDQIVKMENNATLRLKIAKGMAQIVFNDSNY